MSVILNTETNTVR